MADYTLKVQYNIHEAKTQFSRLLALVAQGQSVIIAKNGDPIAELVPYQRRGLRLGAGRNDPDVDHEAVAGDWWRAMTDEEAQDFLEGR